MYDSEEYPDFFGDTPIYSASVVMENATADHYLSKNTIIFKEHILENTKKEASRVYKPQAQV